MSRQFSMTCQPLWHLTTALSLVFDFLVILGFAFLPLRISFAAQDAPSPPQVVQLKLSIPRDTQGVKTTLFKVTQNTQVNLEVTSELSGELHLHAYRLSWPLQASDRKTLTFQAKASGKFNLEWHPNALSSENSTGALKNEHGHGHAHVHAPAIASLEVQPL